MSTDQVVSNTNGAGDSTAPYVQLFQKAHQKIVLLDRIEEQLRQLLGKRQEMQDEIKQVQTAINEQFHRRVEQTPLPQRARVADRSPVEALASAPVTAAHSEAGPSAKEATPVARMDLAGEDIPMATVAPAPKRGAGGRFATQAIAEPDEER